MKSVELLVALLENRSNFRLVSISVELSECYFSFYARFFGQLFGL